MTFAGLPRHAVRGWVNNRGRFRVRYGNSQRGQNFVNDEFQARSFLRDGLAMASMAFHEPPFLVWPADKWLQVT